jgi:superfamily II DNA or RNA helicase
MGAWLRPYQAALVERLRQSYRTGHEAPVLQLATGAGKTWVFVSIVRGAAAKGNRTLIVVHTRELVGQTRAKLEAVGVRHGVLGSGVNRDLDAPVLVETIQSLVRRRETLPAFGLAIFDEAHHSRATTWARLIATQPQAKILGCSATPARTDGKGLGIGCGGCFDDLIVGPSTAELIADKWLSPVRSFVPGLPPDLDGVGVRGGDYVPAELAAMVDTKKITGNAIEEYRRRADHRPAIAFCALVSHAEHVASAFREAGYRSACVEGRTRKAERDRLIWGLGTGEIEVLTSCDLISEGLDVPSVGAVILLRPTKSLALHRQQIGRGMRPAPGKDVLIVNDHVGNTLAHGLPESEPAWSLDGFVPPPRNLTWVCSECRGVNPSGAEECSHCGYRRPARVGGGGRKAPVVVPGELDELTAEKLAATERRSYAAMISGCFSAAELHVFARSRGYSRGWVRRQLWAQEHLSPTERLERHRSWLSERRRRAGVEA